MHAYSLLLPKLQSGKAVDCNCVRHNRQVNRYVILLPLCLQCCAADLLVNGACCASFRCGVL